MASYFDCGYARGVVREASIKFAAGDVRERPQKMLNYYNSVFADSLLTLNVDNVTRNASNAKEVLAEFKRTKSSLVVHMRLWRENCRDVKEEYFRIFNSSGWQMLSQEQKNAHTRKNCSECQRLHKSLQDMFKVNCSKKSYRKPRKLEAQCLVCEKYFQGQSYLAAHMKIHLEEGPHSCPFCDKCFRRKGELIEHLKFHDKKKYPYMCAICEKSYSKLHQLGLHVDSHKDEDYLESNDCMRSSSETPSEYSRDSSEALPAIWNEGKVPDCHSEASPFAIGIKMESDS